MKPTRRRPCSPRCWRATSGSTRSCRRRSASTKASPGGLPIPSGGARQSGPSRPARALRAGDADRPGGFDLDSADRARSDQGSPQHLSRRRRSVLRRGRVRACEAVLRRCCTCPRQRADSRAARASGTDRLSDGPLEPPDFHERLLHALHDASRNHSPVAVLMLDIDDFKRVNDVHGHGVGDELLRLLAEALRSCVRPRMSSAAWAARSSASIMPSCDAIAATQVAERVLTRLAELDFARRRPASRFRSASPSGPSTR